MYIVMAARSPEFGMDHPTVVPENFDPEEVEAVVTEASDVDDET